MDKQFEIIDNKVHLSYPERSVKVVNITPEVNDLIKLVDQPPKCRKLFILYLELL